MGFNELKNAEGYPDPTSYQALRKVRKEASYRPLVYICSPYRGNEHTNSLKAQYYSRFAVKLGYLPITPHIYFPQFMRDEVKEERETAMFMNHILFGKCHELWVFGKCISEGMQRELGWAKKAGKKIRYFNEDLEETGGLDNV